MTTPNTGLPELSNQQNQYLNANAAFAIIDALMQTPVISMDLTAAPGSPANGGLYIMASAWEGITDAAAGRLALYRTGAGWIVITPKEGWKKEVLADGLTYRYEGAEWVAADTVTQEQLSLALADKEQVLAAGTNITIDRSDPENPVINASGGSGGMTNPMTAVGDIIVGGASGSPARLAKGAPLQVVRVNASGTALEYGDPSGGGGSISRSVFDPSKPGGAMKSEKREYISVAGGATIDLIDLDSGAGYLSSVFAAFFGAAAAWGGAIVRVYYDQALTPDIEMPFERFFLSQYAGTQAAMTSEFFGFNRAAADTIGGYCNLPMPYSDGVRITLTNVSATAFTLFSTVMAHTGVPNTWSKTRKLLAHSTYIAAATPDSVHTFLDVSPGVPGRLAAVWFLEDDFPGALTPKGAALEGNIRMYVDGSVTPDYESSGTEDYFLMSFYFGGAGSYRNGGEVGTTFINQAAGTFGCWRTHMRNPLEFTTGLKITWQCGETANVAFTGNARVWATVFYYTE